MKENGDRSLSLWLLGLAMVFFLVFSAAASVVGDGFHDWSVQQSENSWIYTPPGLKQGRVFNIALFPAVVIGDSSHRAWLSRFVAKDAARLGKVTKRGKFTQDNRRTWAVAMEFTSRGGANRQVMYLSPKLHRDSAGILRIVYSDLDTFSKYKYGLKNATELLMSGRYQSGKTVASVMVPNRKKSSEMQASRVRPAFSQAISDVAVSELIYFGFVDFGSNGAYSRYGVLALLADSSCTKGIDTLFKEGVAVSRKKHPEDWGECRIRNGNLEVRWNDVKSFEAMEGFHEKLQPLAVDERLSGCWRKTTGYGGAVLGTTSIAQDKWCFARNGRFSNDAFVGVTGGTTTGGSHTVGSGYSDSSKSGWYRIDGRTIRLIYDNGKKMTKVIGLDEQHDDGSSTLILGNEVFFSQDSG